MSETEQTSSSEETNPDAFPTLSRIAEIAKILTKMTKEDSRVDDYGYLKFDIGCV